MTVAERLNRERLAERAGELADQIGLEEVTFTRLARTLRVARPGLYRHAADIEDLRRAVGQQAIGALRTELSRATSGLAGAEALAAMAGTIRGWAIRHPGRYAALQIAPDLNDELGIGAADRLLGVIASGLRAYALEGDDLTDAIRLVRSTVHGFIALELNDPLGYGRPRRPGGSAVPAVNMRGSWVCSSTISAMLTTRSS